MHQKRLWARAFQSLALTGALLPAFAPMVHAAPTEYTVTPSVIGNGTISPSDPQLIKKNQTATFTLDPDPNYYFVGVTGTCPQGTATNLGGDTYNYTTGSILNDCTVIGNFSPTLLSLTVTATGTASGTVTSSPVGIDCGFDCTEDYDYNTEVTLSATPDTGAVFSGWSGDVDCADGIVTIDASKSCTATFTALYTISASASPSAGGAVSCTPNPVEHNSPSSCTIITNPNYKLGDITGSCGGTLLGDTFTTDPITTDCMVVANFKKFPWPTFLPAMMRRGQQF